MLKKLEGILLFFTVLFLPTQLGRHFWPDFAYIYSLRIDYLSPAIYFWDILAVILVIVWILNKAEVNKTALNLLLIFILSQTVSLIGGDGKTLKLGIVRLEQYLVSGLFGVYIASAKCSLREARKVQSARLFWPLALSILGESVLAILQFFKGGTLGFWILGERTFSLSTPAIAKFDFQGAQFLRPYATFPHPNVLAGFMVVGVSLLLWLRNHKLKWQRGLFNVSALFASLTAFLTVSRTAILAGIAVAMILLKGKWRVILVGLILFLSPILFTRFSAVFNFDNLTILRREELSEVALRMFISSPIFGVGLNNFIPVAADELLAGPSRFLQPVHNIFLLSLSETGIIGVMGSISLIGYPIWCLIKLSPSRFPFNPLLLIWATIIFLGLFDHYFLTLPQGYRLLFMVWGVSISMLKLMNAKTS